MKNKNIWMAVVNHTDTVVFAKGCQSQQKAEMAIVEYLQKNEKFDGKDFGEACFWIGEKDLRLDLQIFEMEAKEFNDIELQAGLLIDPPPKDSGEENPYRVVYIIDVLAADPNGAAETAHRVMTDPDSLAPVLNIIDESGKSVVIDLRKEV